MEKAEKVLDDMNGLMPVCTTYTSLIHGYSTKGQIKEAVRLLEVMSRQGLAPSIVTYNWLMGTLCKNRRWHQVLLLTTGCWELFARTEDALRLERGLKPDVTSYGILLHGYASKGAPVEMNILDLMEMRSQGLNPDIVNYGTVMDALCCKGRVEDAMSHFDQMIDEGISPDIGVELVSEMINKGISPNVVFFTMIVGNLCKVRRIVEAENIFNLMVWTCQNPNVVAYNTLISGYCSAREMDRSMALFHDMVSTGLKPDVVTYNTLINTYYSDGKTDNHNASQF
uniref:Pentacotripeptide-repeat region of PRORP domain-containing protein n=1 Tax=Oryza punctata TaxID=4537 RepID=A0A0E0JG37_ORYPU